MPKEKSKVDSYLNKYGPHCFKCGSPDSLTRYSPDYDPIDGILRIRCECEISDDSGGCGHRWVEVYKLADIDESEESQYFNDLENFIRDINKKFWDLGLLNGNNKDGKYSLSIIVQRPKDYQKSSKYGKYLPGPINYSSTIVKALFESGSYLPNLGYQGENLRLLSCQIQDNADSWSIFIDIARVGIE